MQTKGEEVMILSFRDGFDDGLKGFGGGGDARVASSELRLATHTHTWCVTGPLGEAEPKPPFQQD